MKTQVKQAYEEIFRVLRKHKDVCVFDVDTLERQGKIHLFGLTLKEEYGLDIDTRLVYSLDWNSFGNYVAIGWFGKKHNRIISWSDDGRQPEDELLLRISFSEGAYMFGQDYPVILFQQFFNELKAYNPKYSDTKNSSLYFSMDTAGDVFNKLPDILKKYHDINKKDSKKRQIKKLQEELKQLKS